MRLGLLALGLFLAAPFSAIAAEPPVVFQVQPPGKLLGDVRSIVKMVGGDKAVEEFNGALKEKFGDKGFEGIDLDRPIVGYVSIGEKLEDVVGVFAIPVTGEKEFLELIERLGIPKPKAASEKGVYQLPLPEDAEDGPKVIMRFEAQHAYIAIDPKNAIAAKALIPVSKLYDPADKSAASAHVYFDRLPKELREKISEGLKSIKAQLANLHLPEDASEAARKAVDQLIALGERYFDLLQDAQTAAAKIILDPDSGDAAIEIGLTGKPGSKLAKSIAARQPSTNKFAGLITPDTAVGLKLQLPLFAKEIQSAAVIGLESGQKMAAASAPPQFKGLIDEAFKGLIRTVNDGEFDITVAVRGPDANGFFTVVGAVAFEDPSGLEKEIRGLIKTELPPMFADMIALDVAKVGKTSIHQVKLGGFLPPEVAKVFSADASVAFAFAPKGIFFAFAPDAVETLKSSLGVKKGPSPAFEIVSNPSRLGKLFGAIGKSPEGLGTQDKLFTGFAISIEGGTELRLRLSTNLRGLEGAGSLGFGGEPGSKPEKKKGPIKDQR